MQNRSCVLLVIPSEEEEKSNEFSKYKWKVNYSVYK